MTTINTDANSEIRTMTLDEIDTVAGALVLRVSMFGVRVSLHATSDYVGAIVCTSDGCNAYAIPL